MPAKTGMMKRKIRSDAWTDTRPLNVWLSTISEPELRELGAEDHRQQAADEEEDEARDDVLDRR